MPGLNRKGPEGQGPMTGRKKGRCNPGNKGKTDEEILQERNLNQDTENRASGFGRGKGSGKGMRIGRRIGRHSGGNI